MDKSSVGYRFDPFLSQKVAQLQRGSMWKHVGFAIQELNAFGDKQDALFFAITASLWGNKSDLNFKMGGETGVEARTKILDNNDLIVADDRVKVCDFLLKSPMPVKVGFVNDNTGQELISDMVLADFMLRNQIAESVVFHIKEYPTYVSDATAQDVQVTLNIMIKQTNPELKRLGARMIKYIEDGLLIITSHPFWNSPLTFEAMPLELRHVISSCHFVFVKGDANYRRVVMAKKWNPTVDFKNLVHYFPTSFCCLRTLKSDALIGVKASDIAALNRADKDWRTNGKRGLCQFYRDYSL